MNPLLDLFRLLRPPHPLDNNGAKDGDPVYRAQLYEVRVRDWHWRINNMVLLITMFLGMLIWALSPTGLPMLGAIAWANTVDQKIQAAVNPIQSKVDKIAQQTDQIKAQQDAAELSNLRQKLFETRVAQCKARAQGKDRGGNNPYTDRMQELQSLHYNLTHSYYQAPACEDL